MGIQAFSIERGGLTLIWVNTLKFIREGGKIGMLSAFYTEGVMKHISALFICFLLTFILVGNMHSLEGSEITITILYDNYPYEQGLKTDWGFSCIIKGTEKTILFDAGTRSDILFHNIHALGVNPKDIDLVALSHAHADHTGGLSEILKENQEVSVYVPASFPGVFKKGVENSGAKVVSVEKSVEICNKVHLTGEMVGPANEQAVILDTSKGLIVITGCAHPGIVGMIRRAKEVVNKNIYLVFGGFHLLDKSDAELKEVISQFRDMGVQKVGATHCTGDRAIELFKQAYKEDFIRMGVGKVIQIKD
jgi:7,8-dihydropterin-6-yl-methyl-4-(beta-D-ribofuranosyl)aminobenzene 5'-phosphate synthase